MWEVMMKCLCEVLICLWPTQMECKGKISLGLSVKGTLPQQELVNWKIWNSISKSDGECLLLRVNRKSNKVHKIHKIFNVKFVFYLSSIQADEILVLQFLLLSLTKALIFSRCGFLTLAEAAGSLALIALGLACNARWAALSTLSSRSLFVPLAKRH